MVRIVIRVVLMLIRMVMRDVNIVLKMLIRVVGMVTKMVGIVTRIGWLECSMQDGQDNYQDRRMIIRMIKLEEANKTKQSHHWQTYKPHLKQTK